jgi:hypothetical protein
VEKRRAAVRAAALSLALGGGRYRATGLLFHMPGEWEFVFVLRADGATQRLVRGLRVE